MSRLDSNMLPQKRTKKPSGRRVIAIICLVMTTFIATSCGNDKQEIKFEKLGNLSFHRDKESALLRAKKENRPVFVDFYANWCVNCKLFNKLAVQKGALNTALSKVVLLKIYDTDAIFKDFRQNPEFKELRVGLPLFVVLNPDGSVRWKTTNYKDSTGMIKHLGKP